MNSLEDAYINIAKEEEKVNGTDSPDEGVSSQHQDIMRFRNFVE